MFLFKRLASILAFMMFTGMTQAQDYENWASFYDDHPFGFSESFKAEMAKQLKAKFENVLGVPDAVDRYGFLLMVGQNDLQVIEKDGLVCARVEVVDLRSYSTFVSCCWKSDDISDPKKIQSSDLRNKQVEFSWGSDFPTNDFVELIKAPVEFQKGEDEFKFDVKLFLHLYPDISYNFYFKQAPSKAEFRRLSDFFKDYQQKVSSVYISELMKGADDDRQALLVIDFQSTDMDADLLVKSLKLLFTDLNKLQESELIDQVIVR